MELNEVAPRQRPRNPLVEAAGQAAPDNRVETRDLMRPDVDIDSAYKTRSNAPNSTPRDELANSELQCAGWNRTNPC